MRDDLVKKLRSVLTYRDLHLCIKAANRIEELEAELHLLKTSGIAEVAARNPSVMKYMQHWEGRAEAAEERSEVLEELVMDVVNDLREGVSGSKIDSRICKAMKNLEWGE